MFDLTTLLEGFSGEVSVAFQRLSDGAPYTHHATRTMSAASLIKLPILVAVLAGVAEERLDLGVRLTLGEDDLVGGSGVLQTLQPSLQPTLHDLLTLMTVVSDNTATNMVIDHVGQEAVNAFCGAHGLSQTQLVGKLQLPEEKQNEAQRRGARNRTCAADVLGLLVGLVRGDLLPPTLTETALNILEKQQFTEALARYLPTDPELDENAVAVASKSGCLRGVWHDAGVVFGRSGSPLYALVVMTEGSKDRRFHFEQEGMMLIARVSKRVFESYRL